MSRERILIVGGVAGGASCAARARRLNEQAEIVVFERGPFVSFANCGLPYTFGGAIPDDSKLLVSSPELLRARFNLEVRLRHEVTAIDRQNREVEVMNLESGEPYRQGYDALVLAPGASPIRPPLPGIDLPGIFTLRTMQDARDIRQWMDEVHARTAVVVGAGFVGLEVAENLAQRGLQVTMIEMLPQVMPPLDAEMAEFIAVRLIENHVNLQLNTPVSGFGTQPDGSLVVQTRTGKSFPAAVVILSIGVQPDTKVARDAGLQLGERGAIVVDRNLRTSDPHIWAVGDAVEVWDAVNGERCLLPLAGPAHRQGRIAAESICGRDRRFRGVQGTAICAAFGLTLAMTGASEKTLRRRGITQYEKVYLHPDSHAAYYPGAVPMHLKLLFSRPEGTILGAQAVGGEGVDKRMDVIAMALQMRATVFDLEEAELGYAPQFGSAKDPVNLAGMIAANVLRGDLPILHWDQIHTRDALLVDVRDPLEFASDCIEGAVNIPLGQLRDRLEELPRDREIVVYCGIGQRSYYAAHILLQHGFQARSLSGGFRTYCNSGCAEQPCEVTAKP